eukprot:1564348-Prymnesium_polylepis.1
MLDHRAGRLQQRGGGVAPSGDGVASSTSIKVLCGCVCAHTKHRCTFALTIVSLKAILIHAFLQPSP